MPKITEKSRELFTTKMQPYKDAIGKVFEKEKSMLATMSKDASDTSYKRILLAEDMIYISTMYVLINNLSVELLETKNTDALNEGRKALYKAIIYLEETVTSMVDAAFSEYEAEVMEISNMPLENRYILVRKLGLSIRLVIDAFGDNTKWKWSFVELEGRFATVAKNLLNLKETCKVYFDPRNPDYDTAVYYLKLIKKMLNKAADDYRDRYELSTHRLDDIRLSINYLVALRRIQLLLGDKDGAEETKKKALVWKTKMEIDQKKGVGK